MKIPAAVKRFLNRETVSYLVFGVLTTLVNYAVYFLLRHLSIDYRIANVIAWIFAVLFAFVTNKLFVFESRDLSAGTVLREAGAFAAARVFSLLIEEGFLLLTVGALGADDTPMKLIAAVFVVLLNYVFSKRFIFKKGNEENDADRIR